MAGMRIGFAIGNEKLIKYMNDVKFSINSYTMSRATIALGTAAAKDTEYYKGTCEKIAKTRDRAKNALSRLGFEFPDSKSNFLFVKHKSVEAKTIFEELKKRKIYVRYWDKPLINNYLRITVGTSTDMQKLFDALAEIVK
jgi:histidinol-phosphate aminotransferase